MKTRRKKAARAPMSRRKRSAPSLVRALPTAGPVVNDSGVAPGMQAVSPYLAVANVAATMEFMERAFGFERGVVLPDPDGQLRYAEMRHGNTAIMLIRKGDGTAATGGAAALYTYVQDVDRALMQAREAGAGVGEAEDRPWGDRVAVVTDPDGYRWVLATFKKLAPFS